MHPSTQCTLHLAMQLPWHLAVHHKLLPDQYADAYPSVLIVTRIQTALQYTQTTQMKRKKIFRWYHLDDEHWTLDEVPERTFCRHENGLPHNLCQNPFPYGSNDTVSYMDSLDLSHNSDYEDYMVTSSDEELLGMEEVLYWHWTLVCLNTYLKFPIPIHCVFFLPENSCAYDS